MRRKATPLLFFLLLAPLAAGAPPEGPRLKLAVDGADHADLIRGWPWTFQATLMHPHPYAKGTKPFLLDTKGKPWSDSLRLEITGPKGKAGWTVHSLPIAGSLTLPADQVGRESFWIEPEETAKAAPGFYWVSAVLLGTAQTFREIARSEPLRILVLKTPPAETPDSVRDKHLRFAVYRGLRGETDAAVAETGAILKADPTDLGAMVLEGDILAAAGRKEEARARYQNALEVFHRLEPHAEEPPREIQHKLRELSRDSGP